MNTLEQCAERIVRQGVMCCVSHLVATLVGGNHDCSGHVNVGKPLAELMERALDLAAPVLDEAGWGSGKDGEVYISAQELCEAEGIEPYEREVFEHWAVDNWLADKLEAKGERVDRDFAGLNVWARTTTGQAISADTVIRDIAREFADA